MELSMCAAMPVGGHTREFALQTLGECGGDIRAATLRLMTRPAAPTQPDSRWQSEEVEAFLAGLGHYDKDFYRIAQLVSNLKPKFSPKNHQYLKIIRKPKSHSFPGKNKRLETMYTILLLLEETHERLQTAVLAELDHGSTGFNTSKHRHSRWPTTLCLPAI